MRNRSGGWGGLSFRVWGRIYLVCSGEAGGTAGSQGQNVEKRPRMLLLIITFRGNYSSSRGLGRRTLGVCSLSPSFPLIVRQGGLFGPGLEVVRFARSPKRGPGIPAVTAGAAASNSGISLAPSVPFCAERKSDQLLNAILIMFKISLFGLIGLYLWLG